MRMPALTALWARIRHSVVAYHVRIARPGLLLTPLGRTAASAVLQGLFPLWGPPLHSKTAPHVLRVPSAAPQAQPHAITVPREPHPPSRVHSVPPPAPPVPLGHTHPSLPPRHVNQRLRGHFQGREPVWPPPALWGPLGAFLEGSPQRTARGVPQERQP